MSYIPARDQRWKTAEARTRTATVSHEAQRAFDLELRPGLAGDVSAALQEAIKPIMEKLDDLEDDKATDGVFVYMLTRYKPLHMDQKEFVKQLNQALREWYRPVLKLVEGR